MHRMVRVEQKCYRKLHGIAGGLQRQLGRRVSLSDALEYLLHKRERSLRRFWGKMRQKQENGLAGRGPARKARKVSKKQQLVHSLMNHRLEIS